MAQLFPMKLGTREADSEEIMKTNISNNYSVCNNTQSMRL